MASQCLLSIVSYLKELVKGQGSDTVSKFTFLKSFIPKYSE